MYLYDQKHIEEQVTKLLCEFNIKINCKGYQYLHRAIVRVATGQSKVKMITKKLYNDLAVEYGTTISCIERNIRYSINSAWDSFYYTEAYCKYFGDIAHISSKKPTNAKFISIIAEEVIQRCDEYYSTHERVTSAHT